MVANLMDTIDQLEETHQRLKVEYLDWAFDRFPNDHGIGSNRNSDTTKFLKKHSSSQKEMDLLCNEVMKGINQLSNPMEKYRAYREVYFIHPSFHERWFFDDHLHYLANNLYTGKHGWGLKSFLSKQNLPQKRIEGHATFSIKRTILLENILSGYLDSTLSDYSPIPDAKFPKYQEAIKQIIEPNGRPEKIVSLMPEIFEVIQTLLEKTSFHILESNKLLSFGGWRNYAQCAINEGPIFHKTSSESRVNIFKKISVTDHDELRKGLEKYFEIREVRPFDVENAGSRLSMDSLDLKRSMKEKTVAKNHASPEYWTEENFLSTLREKSGSEKKVEIAKKLIDWARDQGLDLGETYPHKAFIPFTGTQPNTQQLFSMTPHGKMGIEFQFIHNYSQFLDQEKRKELIDRLNRVRGFNFSLQECEEKKKQPVDMELLADPQNLKAFISMATWFFDELQKENKQ